MSLFSWYHWYKTSASLFARSWFICAAVLFVTVMRSGLHYSYGELLVGLRADFNDSSMTEGDWVGTLVMTTSMTIAPISVSFVRLFDASGYQICIFAGLMVCCASCLLSSLMHSMHALVFTYSILQGIGTSVTYMASSLILVDYFDKNHPHHVFGTSTLYCGYPLGSVIFNPIYLALIDEYGWRITLRIAGGILFITAFITTPVFVNRFTNDEYKEMKRSEAKGSLLIPFDKVRRPEVFLWFTVNLTTFLGFYMPVVNLPSYMESKKYEGARRSLPVTMLSFAEIVAYVGASLIGDLLKGRLIVANMISSLALAAIYLMWPSLDGGLAVIMLLSIGSGFFLGFAIVYTFAETVDITQLPQDQAWGYTNLCSGVGLLLGPLLTGGIYDIRKSHNDVFYVTGAIFVFQFFLYCLLVYFVYRRNTRETLLFDPSSFGNGSAAESAPYYHDYTQLKGDDEGNKFETERLTKESYNQAPHNNPTYYGGMDLTKQAQLISLDNTVQAATASGSGSGSENSKSQTTQVSRGGPSRRKSLHAIKTKQLDSTGMSGSGFSIENPAFSSSTESKKSSVGSISPLARVQSSGRMYTKNYSPDDPRILYDR